MTTDNEKFLDEVETFYLSKGIDIRNLRVQRSAIILNTAIASDGFLDAMLKSATSEFDRYLASRPHPDLFNKDVPTPES